MEHGYALIMTNFSFLNDRFVFTAEELLNQ